MAAAPWLSPTHTSCPGGGLAFSQQGFKAACLALTQDLAEDKPALPFPGDPSPDSVTCPALVMKFLLYLKAVEIQDTSPTQRIIKIILRLKGKSH